MLHSHNNYRDKHDSHISDIRAKIQNALSESDFEEVGRLAMELIDHWKAISLDSQTTCTAIINEITALDKGGLAPTSVILSQAASMSEEKFAEWKRRNQTEEYHPLPAKEDEVSPSIALEEDMSSELEVPNEVDDERSLALEAVATTSVVGTTNCQEV